MLSTLGKTRIRKTEEQLRILNQMYNDGMNTTRAKEKTAEASKRTLLPVKIVNEWINNKNKPNRGAVKKRSSKPYNKYTAFMAAGLPEFQGDSKDLAVIAKIRGEKYRALKNTEEGRKLLAENLRKMNEPKPDDLTAAQKHGRALGMFSTIKEQSVKLQHLGYKQVSLVALPNGDASVFGAATGVQFFQNKPNVTEEFAVYVSEDGKGAKQTRKVMKQRIRNLFNKLYAKASGEDGAPMPYTAIEGGALVRMNNLPAGITLKRPRRYRVGELQLILQFANDLEVIIGEEEAVSPSEQVNQAQNSQDQDVPLLSQQHDSPATAEETHPSSMENTVGDDPFVIVQEVEIEGIGASSIPHRAEEIPLPVPTENDGNYVVDTEAPSPAEALSRAQELAKNMKNKGKQTGISKRRSKFIGKKVRHLWTMGKNSKKWFSGVITNVVGKQYYIKYEDDEAEYTWTIQDFNKYRQKKTLIVI